MMLCGSGNRFNVCDVCSSWRRPEIGDVCRCFGGMMGIVDESCGEG